MENESEFMHELRKIIHALATEITINKISSFTKALIAEIKVKRGFTYNNHTFTYYLN